jgi:hypothetical protein
MSFKDVRSTTEQVFHTLLRSGVIADVCVVFEDGGSLCSVQFVVAGRLSDYVVTRRGDVKLYRLGTVMAFLKACGVQSVRVELENFVGSRRQSGDSEF